MRNTFLTSMVLLASLNTFAAPVDWKEHNPTCGMQVEAKINSFGKTSSWVRFIGEEPGAFAYRAPLDIGKWVQIYVDKKGTTVSKMTESEAVTFRYEGEDCQPQVALQNAPEGSVPLIGAFGDVALKQIVEK